MSGSYGSDQAHQLLTGDPSLLRNRPVHSGSTTRPSPALPTIQPPNTFQRAVAGVRNRISSITGGTWFSPQQPLNPQAPADVRGRQWDYPVAWNINYIPRAHEPISFERLRMLSQRCTLMRLAIETRKDQMEALDWSITPIVAPEDRPAARKKYGPEIKMLTEFFQKPDKRLDWPQWQRGILDQHFMYDAVTMFKRKNRGGQLYALEQLDASKITILLDQDGRTPLPPNPAYQHVLKGLPAADYSSYQAGDLIYAIKNWRPDHAYGYGPVEQVITYAEMAIARQREQVAFYTAGDVPRGIMEAPQGLNALQITEIQKYWDSMFLGNIEQRARLWWVPSGTKYVPFEKEVLWNEFDEWLARVICYAFSIAPGPFIKEQNRATAQTNQSQAAAEGLQPTSQWMKRFVNGIIRDCFGINYLGLTWDEDREYDPVKQSIVHNTYARLGARSLDSVRISIGEDPLGGAFATPMYATMNGWVPVDPEEAQALKPPPPAFGAPSGDKPPPKPDQPQQPSAGKQTPKKPGQPVQKFDGSEVISVERPVLNLYELSDWAEDNGIDLVDQPAVIVANIVSAGLLAVPTEILTGAQQPMILIEPGRATVEVDGSGIWLVIESTELAGEMGAFGGYVGDQARMLVSLDTPDTAPAGFNGMLLLGPPDMADAFDGLAKITSEEVDEAAAEATRDPSEAARASGKAKLGHIDIQGLPIAIENATGSIRRGRNDGWVAIMPCVYGFIEDTKDADGDGVDVFIGKDPESTTVFIIDQIKEDGSFDEHKVFLGYQHWADAQRDFIAAYRNADTRGPQHPGHHFIGSVHEWTMDEFKEWLHDADTTKPIDANLKKLEVAGPGRTPFGGDPLNDRTGWRTDVSHLHKAGRRHPGIAVPIDDHVSDIDVEKLAGKIHPVLTEMRDETISEVLAELQKADADPVTVATRITSRLAFRALRKLVDISEDLGTIAVKAGRAAATAVAEAVQPADRDDDAVWREVDRRAIDASRRRAAALVGMRYDENGKLVPAKRDALRIDESTRDMLRRSLTSALKQGKTASEVRDQLSDDYAFSLPRALTIARTESAQAHTSGAMTGYRATRKAYNLGMKKSWLLGAEACDVCEDNAAQGEIDLDDSFESGDDASPAHPNCRCDIAITAIEE